MAGNANSGGRNKKSAAEHVLHGTFRSDRHGDDATPEPPRGDPVPPEVLTGKAKREWFRMVERLRQSRTLSIVDDASLLEYAQLYGETQELVAESRTTRRLLRQLKKQARGLTGPELVAALEQIVELEKVVRSDRQQLRHGHMAIRIYLVEFGMTPSARTRVKASSGPKPQSAVEKFRSAKTSA